MYNIPDKLEQRVHLLQNMDYKYCEMSPNIIEDQPYTLDSIQIKLQRHFSFSLFVSIESCM